MDITARETERETESGGRGVLGVGGGERSIIEATSTVLLPQVLYGSRYKELMP